MILSEHVTISRDLASRILEIFNQGWIPTKEFIDRKEELNQAILKEFGPAPLQLKEGCWYERRDGKVVGPARPIDNGSEFKWAVGVDHRYKDNGRWRSCETDAMFDLIREVPAPVPKYRPFANAEEYAPHRDKWLKDVKGSVARVSAYTDARVYTTQGSNGWSWDNAFELFQFEDGTPFGVKADE